MNKQDGQKSFKQATNLSPISGAFNFIVMMLGTALVATAYSFSLATPFFGILTDFTIALWAWLAALSTFKPAVISGATSSIDVGRRLLGNKTLFQKIINFLLITLPTFLVLIGALSAYITIATSSVLSYFDLNENLIQVIFAIVIAILGSLRSFDHSKFISYGAFGFFLVVVGVTIYASIALMLEIEITPPRRFVFGDYIQAFPILALGVNGNMCLPGMAGEMTPSAQRRFPTYILISKLVVATINSCVGFFPSYLFGSCTQSDSMVHLSCYFNLLTGATNIPILIAQLCLAVAVIIQAPLFVIPLKELALDSGEKAVRDRSILTNIIASCVLAAIAGMLGIFLGNITQTLNTVTTVGALILMGPTASILTYVSEKSTFAMIRVWILMIIGLFLLGINFYTIFSSFTENPVTIIDNQICTCEQN